MGGGLRRCVCVRAQRYNHWSVFTASFVAGMFVDCQEQVMKLAVVIDEPRAS